MSEIPEILDFSQLSSEAIAAVLKQYQLRLSPDEARTIQNTLLKRPPTFTECVLWSIQGSEHCSYKSSRKHLKGLKTDAPHVISGAKEDAGIVTIATDDQGRRYGLAVSQESHNHPSQIVPYEGAATGVGGNVRDVCCMGAEVIALADGLRFGDLSNPKTHWIHSGVVAGIGGYGNPIGVPNIAGDLYYDSAYNENCLVTVVTLGIVREDHVIHSFAPKDLQDHVFILVGKPTDQSGFGGASFASSELDEDEKENNKGAVQEPNAFLQRHLLKANYSLFSWLQENSLLHQVGFKDLGAGGIACASVELAEAAGFGAEIDLEKVPIQSLNLLPHVILCAETQERFMWVVPQNLAPHILTHYNETFALPKVANASAAIIGKIRADGFYVVKYKARELVNARAYDVTKGILYDRPYELAAKNLVEPEIPVLDLKTIFLKLLAHENIASRAPIFETYDKQVQGRTQIERDDGPAGVLHPFNSDSYPEEIRKVGVALALAQNPRYNKINAYLGAVHAVLEAVRRVTAVGATPVALTDCLCFGNPEKPEQMAEFVESVRGMKDATAAISMKDHSDISLPIIAGNVSFYNESGNGAIPPSPMISCVGLLPDVSKAVTYSFKRTESILILIGERKDECGGSAYYQLHDALGENLPKIDLLTISEEIHAIHEAIQKDLVLSALNISLGGTAVTLAKMSFKNQIGFTVKIPGELALEKKLFSETPGFILEIGCEKIREFRQLFSAKNIPFIVLGETNTSKELKFNDALIVSVEEARKIWEQSLGERLL